MFRPCKRGHVSGRYKGGQCIACIKLSNTKTDNATKRARALAKHGQEKLNADGRAQYRKRRAAALITMAKKRAKLKGVPFDLDKHISHYAQIIEAGACQLTGLSFTLDPDSKHRVTPFAPSLDRVRPELGYVHGNVRIVIWALNTGFSDWGQNVYAQVAKAFFRNNPWEL